ncbi:Uncharacterized protein APZ42_006910, partial [Daphnia magna]
IHNSITDWVSPNLTRYSTSSLNFDQNVLVLFNSETWPIFRDFEKQQRANSLPTFAIFGQIPI